MKKGKEFLFTVIMMLCITLVIAIMPTEKDAAIYTDTVRLHILASSDSEADQNVKYEIRDRILRKYAAVLKNAHSPDKAKENVAALTESIEKDVGDWLKEYGCDYGCTVTVGTEWYDTRKYEDFTLPKGYYTSLCVMLGKAEGKNWWCVMYPPLCLDIASEDAPPDAGVMGYTKEEYALISNEEYQIKFKILELFSDAFSKNG